MKYIFGYSKTKDWIPCFHHRIPNGQGMAFKYLDFLPSVLLSGDHGSDAGLKLHNGWHSLGGPLPDQVTTAVSL